MSVFGLIPSARQVQGSAIDTTAIKRCVTYCLKGGSVSGLLCADEWHGDGATLSPEDRQAIAETVVQAVRESSAVPPPLVLVSCGAGQFDDVQTVAQVPGVSGLLVRAPPQAAGSPAEMERFVSEMANLIGSSYATGSGRTNNGSPPFLVIADGVTLADAATLAVPAGLQPSVVGRLRPVRGWAVRLGVPSLRCDRIRQALGEENTLVLAPTACLANLNELLSRSQRARSPISLLVPCALAPVVGRYVQLMSKKTDAQDRVSATALLQRLLPILIFCSQHPLAARAADYRLCRGRNLCAEPPLITTNAAANLFEWDACLSASFDDAVTQLASVEAELAAAQSAASEAGAPNRAYGLLPRPPGAKGREEAGGQYAAVDQVAVISTAEAGGEYQTLPSELASANHTGGEDNNKADTQQMVPEKPSRSRELTTSPPRALSSGVSKETRSASLSSSSGGAPRVPTLRLIHLPDESALAAQQLANAGSPRIVSPRSGGTGEGTSMVGPDPELIRAKEEEIRRLQMETKAAQSQRAEQMRKSRVISPRGKCEHCRNNKAQCKVKEEETGRSFMLCRACARNLMASGAMAPSVAHSPDANPSGGSDSRLCGRCQQQPPTYSAVLPSGVSLALCLDCALTRDGASATLTSPRETILAPLALNRVANQGDSASSNSPKIIRALQTLSPRGNKKRQSDLHSVNF